MSARLARIRALRARQQRYRPDLRAFERLVAEVLDDLPSPFREHISNVAVEVAEEPAAGDGGAAGDRGHDHDAHDHDGHHHDGHDDDLLGLYQGVPYGERGTDYHLALPDRITIYRRPILDLCRTEEEVRAEVRDTVLHEIGHYFGLDDDELP